VKIIQKWGKKMRKRGKRGKIKIGKWMGSGWDREERGKNVKRVTSMNMHGHQSPSVASPYPELNQESNPFFFFGFDSG